MKQLQSFLQYLGACRAQFLVVVLLSGCGGAQTSSPVHAFAEGVLRIALQPDSTSDFSDFELVVVSQTQADPDTLGRAVTDRSGRFSMDIHAEEPGIYPLIVSRAGATLSVEQLVVADGDSSTVTGTYPLGQRRLRIVSNENAAWMAYRNARLQHSRMLNQLLGSDTFSIDEMRRIVLQTSTILWNLRATYPETMGASLGAAESTIMLEGWYDSLLVARLDQIETNNASIVQVVQASRRAVARLDGLDSSLALIDAYLVQVSDPELKAELQAEKVVALSDSSYQDRALAEALILKRNYPDTKWAEWANRATYELENLLPGMVAPTFSVVDRSGDTLSTVNLAGKYLVLEFFDPMDEKFNKELAERNRLISRLDARMFTYVSVSLESDPDLIEAFFEDRTLSGTFSIPEGGYQSRIARTYNVHVSPTRYLIGPDEKIIARYSGPTLQNMDQDIARIIADLKEFARNSR